MDSALREAIKAAGGPVALAGKLGIRHQAIPQWKRCPAERVLAVEAASGISRHNLRPDLYPREPSTTDLPFGCPP